MSVEPVGRRLCNIFSNFFGKIPSFFANAGALGANGWLWFAALFIFILLAGYFAAAETALNSVNKIRIRNLAENGGKRAAKVLYILDNMEKALSTLLIGTNVMHISCASIATLIATKLWGAGAVTYSTVVITLLVFMFSEMIPKSYANEHAESFALAVSGSVSFLMKLLTPFSFFFTKISEGFAKLLTAETKPTVDEDELYDIIETIQEEGSIEKNKSSLIYSALEFDDIAVSDVLTPRIDVVTVDINDSINEMLSVVKNVKYSRIPVKDGSVDNMIGILITRRFIKNYIACGCDFDVKTVIDEPLFVHKSMPVDELLKAMNAKKQHMAIVRDEYGGTYGIVTSEDILEELVGEIWDEDDEVKVDFKKLSDECCEVSGDMDVADVLTQMGIKDFDRDELEYKTMNSLVLEHFDEDIPHEGSNFNYAGVNIAITEMKRRRITKLTVTVNRVDGDGQGEAV